MFRETGNHSMNNQTTQDKFAALKEKSQNHVTTEDILQRGLEVLDATGLPLEDVAALARSVGLGSIQY
jgi:hypothetical protein